MSASQGDIDIYVDDVFKETVSAHHASRLTQQAVYSISGLANGAHTIKAVKKSGEYMLVDGVKFEVNAATVPSATPSATPTSTASPSATPTATPEETIAPTPSATPTITPTSAPVTTNAPAKELITIDVENAARVVITRTTQADGKKTDDVPITVDQAQKAVNSVTAAGHKLVTITIPDTKDEVTLTSVTLPKEAKKCSQMQKLI